MKKYFVVYEVRAYREKDSAGYNIATGRFTCSANSKIDAINKCLKGFEWDEIYKDELGYLPKKIEFEKFKLISCQVDNKKEF